MHELSLCQALLSQVEAIATREGADAVSRILVRIGPLAGVEPELLSRAYTSARAGTLSAAAELVIETQPLRVRCLACGEESEVSPEHLSCAACGDPRTRLVGGDELLLASVELLSHETMG
jgi:hydrogenase nickel incorporation protein HypA/HybF